MRESRQSVPARFMWTWKLARQRMDFRRDLPVRMARGFSLLPQSLFIWPFSGSTSLPWMTTTSRRKMTRQLHPAKRIARSGSSPTNLSPRIVPILGSSCSASCPDTGFCPCLCLCPCRDPSLPGSRVRDGRASRTRSRVWRLSHCPWILGRRPSSCFLWRWIFAP